MTEDVPGIFTKGELEFMQVLWSVDEATPDEMQAVLADRGRSVTGGTIRNVLATLMAKGYVTRRKESHAHRYRAIIGEDQAKRTLLTDLLDRVFGGSESHLVASLLKTRSLQKKDLDALKNLIAEREKGG